MGKIVKYCAACEESFAEKFGFCPNCGKPMEAFEMSPVMDEVKPVVESAPVVKTEPIAAANEDSGAETILPELNKTLPNFKYSEPAVDTKYSEPTSDTKIFATSGKTQPLTAFPAVEEVPVSPVSETVIEPEDLKTSTVAYSANDLETFAAATAADENKSSAAAVSAGLSSPNVAQYQPKNYNRQTKVSGKNPYNEGFNVTVIKERNGKQRNLLLLGALVLMLTVTVAGVVVSIFNHPLFIGAIGDDAMLTLVPEIDDVPMEVDPPEIKKPDKGGGGGGGGREEETPTSKGRLATQTPDPPLITPTKTIPQKDNFELKMQATTQGN